MKGRQVDVNQSMMKQKKKTIFVGEREKNGAARLLIRFLHGPKVAKNERER